MGTCVLPKLFFFIFFHHMKFYKIIEVSLENLEIYRFFPKICLLPSKISILDPPPNTRLHSLLVKKVLAESLLPRSVYQRSKLGSHCNTQFLANSFLSNGKAVLLSLFFFPFQITTFPQVAEAALWPLYSDVIFPSNLNHN